MSEWKKTLVAQSATLREAIAMIDQSALQIAMVIDAEGCLLGTLTDGDIRRALLRGNLLDTPVEEVMNASPTVAQAGEDLRSRLPELRSKHILRIPVIDSEGRVVGLQLIERLSDPLQRSNWVVLMAGGLGSRLRPLTNDCPKPMLKVGEKPILESILQSFIEQGFRNFYISVNYMGDLIREHFGDGSRWGVDIRYLVEDQRLGTAGALSLLPSPIHEPFFVMNGDILARVNFNAMLEFHENSQASACVGVRQITHSIPYGVVRLDGHRMLGIVEKPEEKVFVSAGIYVLSPSVMAHIPQGVFFDMPTLIQALISAHATTVAFPIHEYWLDIGRMEDYAKAHDEYRMTFQ